MICKKCGADNITKAEYCKNCGLYFLPEEREAAYGKTIYGKIEKLEKWHGYATLDFITGNLIFKIAVLVLILFWGMSVFRSHGNEMTILEHDTYQVQQNKENEDFYVFTEYDKISLSLYLPKEAEELSFRMVEGDKVLQEEIFTAEDEILLETNETVFYEITADYGRKEETIKVFVLKD